MLRECISLWKSSISVCGTTKEGMEEGPVKGLEVRAREVYFCWPNSCCHGDCSSSLRDIPLVCHEQPKGFELSCFKPEAVSALEKRLLQDMQAVKSDGGKERSTGSGKTRPEAHKLLGLRSAPKKARGKCGASGSYRSRRNQRANPDGEPDRGEEVGGEEHKRALEGEYGRFVSRSHL
jgi:hypothetical protein